MPDGTSVDFGLLTLYSANKAYSPWSLCAWLALSLTGQPFGQVVVPLGEPDTAENIRACSPSGKLPVLRHGDQLVWDSMAIGEYLAETFPEARLWPTDPRARAHARSICAEVHAGFPAIRRKLPFNMRGYEELLDLDRDVEAEIARVTAIWSDCALLFADSDEPYLYGELSLADAMYAPVAVRFTGYGVPLAPAALAYCQAIWEWPALQQWYRAALDEPWAKEEFEL